MRTSLPLVKWIGLVGLLFGVGVAPAATFTDANWFPLGAGMNGGVDAVAFNGQGNLYAGGLFNTAGGVSATYVAKWDGNFWTNLGAGLSDEVLSFAFDPSDNVYVGGYFTNAGGVAANRIAKWDGSSWTNLGSGMNNSVITLQCDPSGNLYAGGAFTNAGGVTANRIAKWNGSSWTNLGAGMDNVVRSLAFDRHTNLYAGGAFANAGGVGANGIAEWNGSSWTNLGLGLTQNPTDGVAGAWALAFDSAGLLYAGGFHIRFAGGMAATNIAKWNGNSWTNLGSGVGVFASSVNGMAWDGSGGLYVGGDFTNAGGVAARNIAKWNGTTWTNFGSGMDAYLNALTFDSFGNLYAGGTFANAGGVAARNIARAIFGYELWAAPITNGLSRDTQCATGDGYPNLLKYATGSSPTNSDALALMKCAFTNSRFCLIFNRNTNATDVTLAIQGANALTNSALWRGVATNTAGSWGSATNVAETGTTNPITVTVQDTVAIATNRFLRLRVTRP